MTGLDLEAFLRLHRADWGAWLSLAAIAGVIGLMAWTSFGRRKVLRKCLVLSVAAHIGLVAYGGALPIVGDLLRGGPENTAEQITPVQVTVVPPSDPSGGSGGGSRQGAGRGGQRRRDFDKHTGGIDLGEPGGVETGRPEPTKSAPVERQAPVFVDQTVSPSIDGPVISEPTAPPIPVAVEGEAPPASIVEVDPSDIVASPSPRPAAASETGVGPLGDGNLRARARQTVAIPKSSGVPSRSPVAIAPVAPNISPVETRVEPGLKPAEATIAPPGIETASIGLPAEPPRSEKAAEPDDDPGAPDSDLRKQVRPGKVVNSRPVSPVRPTLPTIAGVTPALASNTTTRGVPNGIVPIEIPKIYQSRLDPKRSELAQKAGASAASEEAVEKALDWLKRHQDSDGRWNGGTAKYDDGRVVPRDENYTTHCPLGDICAGECLYHDADTALTGLALLAYLGAGYTHTDGGKYSETVASGLSYLTRAQKSDGDLRGQSTAVGMYCHSMASLALSEAYALTRDPKLRAPVEKAVNFLVRSQATDGMAWRYSPRASAGDTSILGWVILVLKSASEVGINVPATTRSGAIKWLGAVGDGLHGGLGRYQPNKPITPAMTAEAWVCRQFLGIGGPGLASNEAADYLLRHSPSSDGYNLYYWYYGTLALFQHGGPKWDDWNRQVRDQLVGRQRTGGHALGSWDPDQTEYGVLGGRIYSTAVATLTLEVYYRYLRLYETPKPKPDTATRRAGVVVPKPPK